jgi:hypothetical protein
MLEPARIFNSNMTLSLATVRRRLLQCQIETNSWTVATKAITLKNR